MKIFSSTHDFEYSWDEVSTANWRKYCPWNKESGHVIAVDTLSRRVDQKTGILRTERLITCQQSAPKWLVPILGGSDVSYVYEVSYVRPPLVPASVSDPAMSQVTSSPSKGNLSNAAPPRKQEPSVTMVSVNLTWADLLNVHETVVYKPSNSAPNTKTTFDQNAKITALCGGWQRIKEKIETFTVDRFGENAAKGRQGFEEVLEMSRRVFGEEKEKERREREISQRRLSARKHIA